MGLNIKKVQALKEAKLNKPAPIIKIGGKSVEPLKDQKEEKPERIKTEPIIEKVVDKAESSGNQNFQLEQLEIDMARVMKERKILSTQTARLVDEIVADLTKESEATANEFLNGNLPHPRLRDHAARIEAKSEEIRKYYDQIEHLKKYGAPKQEQANKDDSAEAKALKYEKRRLGDMVCKKLKNIADLNKGLKKPRNSDRVNAWRGAVALAEARITEIDITLRAMRL